MGGGNGRREEKEVGNGKGTEEEGNGKRRVWRGKNVERKMKNPLKQPINR